ncbi:E3 ubiquitin-protein ligase BOI-like isoform X1 [Hibiscus syriacus]|uniref:E3 ubiquitin-protein ligase BOI-like isoform X1 n=1 Tax=Hibiscus syriacus TaxID=106335 RepID=UPI001923DEE5|nr:E3 ubiquitin-protein ligase BOI-like isoform X1 [Hibiscus syriacus]
MAVKAPNMNLFPPLFIPNGDFIKVNQGSGNIYNTQMKTSINKADSGVTYNMNIPVSAQRKRPRDESYTVPRKNNFSGVFSQIQQQQQQEIDRLIAQHIEKVSVEVEERRKKQSRMFMTAIQEGVMKKLKEKDDEIQRMGKLNWVLQERVKSLSLENQLWRDLAQTTAATANSLRTNLEQVLAQVGEERHANGGGSAADAESSCGSSDEGWRRVLAVEQPQEQATGKCRKCGEKESSVVLLPCRHLCLCAMCGSTRVAGCPVCDSATNASVHVNMS